jgi:hypothetical protein
MANAWARTKVAGTDQRGRGTNAATDAALIVRGDGERGAAESSGNPAISLPFCRVPAKLAALLCRTPFAITELWMTAAETPATGSPALRWLAR